MILFSKNKIIFNASKSKYNSYYLNTKKDLNRILNYVVSELKENKCSVGLHLISKEKITELNKETRDIDKPTDVLSYPMLEKMERKYYLGDIFINSDLLKKQSKEINSDESTEVKFLFMHGLLHLIGFDHKTNEEEEEMTSKQREIFRTLGIRKW